MSKKPAVPTKLFKKGQIVEVKGDQVAGGSTWALYWFRGKITQVNRKGRKATYNVKMEDPTRFGQKKLIVKNLPPRYVRSGEAKKKVAIGKNQKKREKKKSGAYGAAGAEGSVCESWEETLARERKEQEAMGIIPETVEENAVQENNKVEDPTSKADDEFDELEGLDEKYRKGVDIRKKIEEIKTEEFHLMDRNTLRYGDSLFKKGDEVKYRDQIYEVKRIRMYKERPVLMLENRRDGLRRAECKDCKVEKSVDDIRAEKAKLAAEKLRSEEVDEKERLSLDEHVDEEELNIDDVLDKDQLTSEDFGNSTKELDTLDVQESESVNLIRKADDDEVTYK